VYCRLANLQAASEQFSAAQDSFGAAIRLSEQLYGRGSVRVAHVLLQVGRMFHVRKWNMYAGTIGQHVSMLVGCLFDS
jgi:hypothetical protein